MSDGDPIRPPTGVHVLHRSLDVQGHAEPIRSASSMSINETYQDEEGQHLWTLKRFPGVPAANASNPNNPKEVEQVRK